jgi:alpha-beta hydrolase superfamily lysophospholipase
VQQRTPAQPERQQPGGTSPFASSSGRVVVPTASADSTPSSSSWQQAAGVSAHRWQWRGHSIHYVTAGCGKPVLLVHGFGASCGHYRRTIPFLAQHGFKVGTCCC